MCIRNISEYGAELWVPVCDTLTIIKENAQMANAKLSQLSKDWKAAEPIAPSFSNIPEGDYVAALREMKVEESKKGKLQVVSTYEIVDGEYTGETVKRFDGLQGDNQIDNRTRMGYFKGYAEIIGLDIPEDIELLQDSIDTFVGNCGDLFNIHVKKGKSEDGTKDYTNIYVNGISDLVLGEEGQEEGEIQEEVVDEGQEVVEEEVAEEGQEEVAEEIIEEVMEEPQQITAPMKRFSAKPAQKVNGKAAPVAQAVKPTVKTTAKTAVLKNVSQPAKTVAPATAGRRIAAVRK